MFHFLRFVLYLVKCPPFLTRFLRVSKAHEILHGIKAGSLDDDVPFPLDVEHLC
jgi:hypothetical protein